MKAAPFLKIAACFLILGGTLGSVSADQVVPKVVSETGLFYQPNRMGAGIRVIRFSDNVVDRPTVWGLSAKLDADAVLTTSEGADKIPAGSILPEVKFMGIGGALGEVTGFCTPVRKNVADSVRGGLFASLQLKIQRSLEDGRKCVVDLDGDGLAEMGFLLDDGNDRDRVPHKINPVQLNIAKMREREPGNRVVISVYRTKKPAFSVHIFEQDKQRVFGTINSDGISEESVQAVPKGAQFPVDMVVFGAKLRVISSNAKERTVTVETFENQEYRSVPLHLEVTMR